MTAFCDCPNAQAISRSNVNNFERHVAILYDGKAIPRILPDKAFDTFVALMEKEKDIGDKILQVNFCVLGVLNARPLGMW